MIYPLPPESAFLKKIGTSVTECLSGLSKIMTGFPVGTRAAFTACFLLFFAGPAHAYLDPGSGSILIYALAGIFATAVYSARGFAVYGFYALFSGKKNKKGDFADVIVHSEGRHYDHLFLPLLRELAGSGLKIRYVTQYERDLNLPELPGGVEHETLSAGAYGFVRLNHLAGRILVTTTPQLGVMMFKKSPRVDHYAYLFHSPTDIDYYKPFSFDHYDSVLCVGDFMKKNIRDIEKARGRKEKRLITTGLIYYDEMSKRKKSAGNEKPVVLIAPSWGEIGLFTVYGTDFLSLLDGDYRVIVRPHPQIRISQPDIYTNIIQKCADMGFETDDAPSIESSLFRADVMIGDFSGAVYDFFYVREKPVIIMDTRPDPEAREGRILENPLLVETARKEIGCVIDETNISEINRTVERMLQSPPENAGRIRDKYIANYGQAAPVAAEQILCLHSELSSC